MDAIKEAIEQLPLEEQSLLASWLNEQAWEGQIERDFSTGGRGMPLLAEVERHITEAETGPAEEALKQAK